MKNLFRSSPVWVRLTALAAAVSCLSLPARAVTFTSNANIGAANTNFDGLDIVVTNCALTIDGPHTFSSLRVESGGVVTHSPAPAGTVSNIIYVVDEAQTLDGTNAVTLLESNVVDATVSVTDGTGTILYTNNQDYLLTSTNNIWTQLQRTTNSAIPDGATVLVGYQSLLPGSPPGGLYLTISNNVEVYAGGSINANGTGFAGGAGSGTGHTGSSNPPDGSGGGYGGMGGMSSSNALGGSCYGSYNQPANLGSGGGIAFGGPGGSGGGLINISAGGYVIIDGTVSANGANATNDRSGGGSGGSIWLTGLTLSGSGAITANGGSGDRPHGGGGGGGRIALQYSLGNFNGSMTTYGGAGSTVGGAGTVFTQAGSQNALVTADNGGQAGANTILTISTNSVNVQVQGHASVVAAGTWTVGSLTVASNGFLIPSTSATLNLTASGPITVAAGGGIVADSAGNQQGQGVGAGNSYNGLNFPCSGGGYGGYGAASNPTNALGGTYYGSQISPSGLGSGGGFWTPYSFGGNGGGAIKLTSLGSVVQVDGVISANGGAGFGSGGGGGSGGTISILGGTLLGSGTISANGGAGVAAIGGGGGGGRIYLTPATNLFNGTISAFGGGGGNRGGAGTVLIQVPGQNSQLILDNNGILGTNTPVTQMAGMDLIVRNAAIGTPLPGGSFADLYIYSNSWLAPLYFSVPPAEQFVCSFTGNATIQRGGGIMADFSGYSPGLGSGNGRSSGSSCSGAGHGGIGGNSISNAAVGGPAYDTITEPLDPGSGGGTSTPYSIGGFGGGAINLSVTGTLENDGIISANGGNGSGAAGGGGSGGSVWLRVGTFSGTGSIAANGGNGVDSSGGGGAGGLIYVSCNVTNSYTGNMTAYGGSGANWGGAGQTAIQNPGQHVQLVLDGGGNSPGFTPLGGLPGIGSTTDVTLRNGAVGVVNSSLTLGNLLVESNSSIIVSNVSSYTTLNCSSATVQAGGEINDDFLGYPAGGGQSPGHSDGNPPNYPCGGGGHGGIGGAGSTSLAGGGNAYDLESSPLDPGSGGGSYSRFSAGGAGGGALSLTVTGLLQVDGIISANGANGSGIGGGGGAGGTIKLSAATLAGAGVIRANGGTGANINGGGGAGGCIALTPTTDSFTGTISAFGGGGANWGGAGTIYTQSTYQNGQLTIDNGRNSGAATPIGSFSSTTSVILGNGAVGYLTGQPQTIGALTVNSNGWLNGNPLATAGNGGLVLLTVQGAATIAAGGGIVTDGQGYGPDAGVGQGRTVNGYCGGGGDGGAGGAGGAGQAPGGLANDSITLPGNLGSGGGTAPPNSIGGAGGGLVRLTVSGTLNISGRISANGSNGTGVAGGGGSGGGIYLSATTLAGNGSITANGGSGAQGSGGGGGGGRISLNYTTADFIGTIFAYGGGGAEAGGAGTIYSKTSSQAIGQLLLDDGGAITAAGTPVSTYLGAPSQPFNLTVQNGAVATPEANVPAGGFPTFNNLTIGSGGVLTGLSTLSNLDLVVQQTLWIEGGGVIDVDGQGLAQGFGYGAGQSTDGAGSGAGYGGTGGASTTVPGGQSYGSASQPVDRGSGGGYGEGPLVGGSQGGGAIRFNIGGVFIIDGELSAEGGAGLQDESGGGSGGSIWVNAKILEGNGLIAADGGDGQLYNGGGGAGGRIALYSDLPGFVGEISANGGGGAFDGGNGTIVNSSPIPTLQVLSNSPSGVVSNNVIYVTIYFNNAPNPNSVSGSAITLNTPTGLLPTGSISVSSETPETYLLTLPQQTTPGTYTLTVGPNITDLYGQPMAQAYTATFTISLPVLQGTITDTNGNPIPGVVLQSSGFTLTPTTTDSNGNYTMGFVPGVNFTITPSLTGWMFNPPSISYTSPGSSLAGQNYVGTSFVPALVPSFDGTNFIFSWNGISGITYQMYTSTNLINWTPYGSPIPGNGVPVQAIIPVSANAQQFFSLQAGN
jgi:hypothetical protein